MCGPERRSHIAPPLAKDRHAHRCGGCGHVFTHARPPLALSRAEFDEQHKCPKCLAGPWRTRLPFIPIEAMPPAEERSFIKRLIGHGRG